jgi:membrane protein YdbS with pleckstrin-like domain
LGVTLVSSEGGCTAATGNSSQQVAHVGTLGRARRRLAFRAALRLVRAMKPPVDDAAILAIERPGKALWTYYLLRCLVIPPLFPILVLPFYFRYHTMRYRFTAEGISMSWGILFRHEVILNYARIQDIHLRSNLIERWLGLARILVQTASGSAAAEMCLEGLKEFEAVRDFLYARMRGVKEPHRPAPALAPHVPAPALDAASVAELTATLREVCGELRGLRESLDRTPPRHSEGGGHV